MQSFLTNMICCRVIRLTFILFPALIMAPIPDTEASALPEPGVHLSDKWRSRLVPFHASPMLANAKKGINRGASICISLASTQFMGQQPVEGELGRLPGQREKRQ